jgi:D-tyrosyl-tRNA(Tyr) deacylase|tara:strand:- start:1324 stop:1767 length:444 start_codon:yes stop_codon:yes gene_type:complete
MIAVVQRVLEAGVYIDDPPHAESIKEGLCVLLGVEEGDDSASATWIAKKLSNLRIFCDQDGKMNLSILDIKGELLLVSQFTLSADCTQGNRPSFIKAAKPELAEPLVAEVGNLLKQYGIPIKCGIFGAMMRVEIQNDGPVTIILKQD